MWLTKRLLLWCIFISISAPTIGVIPGILIHWCNQGLFGIIFFIVMFPLYIVYVLIKFFADIMPKEIDKLISKNREWLENYLFSYHGYFFNHWPRNKLMVFNETISKIKKTKHYVLISFMNKIPYTMRMKWF